MRFEISPTRCSSWVKSGTWTMCSEFWTILVNSCLLILFPIATRYTVTPRAWRGRTASRNNAAPFVTYCCPSTNTTTYFGALVGDAWIVCPANVSAFPKKEKTFSHKQICLRGENIEIVRSIFVGCHVALIFQRKIGPSEQVTAKFSQTLFRWPSLKITPAQNELLRSSELRLDFIVKPTF